MTATMCSACGANWPNAGGGLCSPCRTDLRGAERQREVEAEARRRDAAAARRRGRPAWRPETGDRNHGHGSALEAQRRPA